MIFFKPDKDFVNWILKYAGKRLIIEVGAGRELHLAQCLMASGCKSYIAIDPEINYLDLHTQKLKQNHKISFHPIPLLIQDTKHLLFNHPNLGSLVIIVRPCHSDFVEYTIESSPSGVEILYITKPENVTRYNDLGVWAKKAKLINHQGTSDENEVVYSIKK